MSSFTNALIAKKDKGRTWEVVEPFTYMVGSLDSGEGITVPKGFVSDLASVPQPFWSIMPPDDSYAQAAVLHDWLCWNKGWAMGMLPYVRAASRCYTPRRTTEIFEEAMAVLEVAPWRRAIMFRAVLMFGPKW